jgi:hypothetical protein
MWFRLLVIYKIFIKSFINPMSYIIINERVYFLTYSMVQSPSWAANWFEPSQEISRISRNPKIYYRTHNRPPPVSNLDQSNPAHIPTSHLLEIRPNINHPSTPMFPQRFLPSSFPNKTLYIPLTSSLRVTCPAHLILLDFITRKILNELV